MAAAGTSIRIRINDTPVYSAEIPEDAKVVVELLGSLSGPDADTSVRIRGEVRNDVRAAGNVLCDRVGHDVHAKGNVTRNGIGSDPAGADSAQPS